MRRLAAVLVVCSAAWSPWARAADAASASPPPGADQIQFAAREHDLGYRAYLDKQYDEAASHFENAFFAAPNPAELRSAVRARHDAGELARAATLAAMGQRRFPEDSATNRIAEEVIAEARPHVYEVRIASPVGCSIAVDEKMVIAERLRDSRLFLNPGAHELMISWSEDRNARIPINAAEGGSTSLEVEPPKVAPPPPSPPEPPPPPSPSHGAVEAATATPPPPKPLTPAVFVVGAAMTAVSAGFTIWSGIDTVNNPGAGAVRENCVGLGASCSLYEDGRRAQLRTNILLATTCVFGVATAVVGVFFTQWPRPAGTMGVRAQGVSVGISQDGVEGTF